MLVRPRFVTSVAVCEAPAVFENKCAHGGRYRFRPRLLGNLRFRRDLRIDLTGFFEYARRIPLAARCLASFII